MNSQRLTTAILGLVAAAITIQLFVLPFYSSRPLPLGPYTQDTGAILTMTRELHSGKKLYEQIYTPYGPVPHGIYETMAWKYGNTPLTYLGFTALFSLLALTLEFVLVRRHLSLPLALGFYILVISHYDMLNIVYWPFEVIGIVLLAIFWIPADQRTISRSVLYGTIFCLIHLSKFGSDLVAGCAFVLLDLLYLSRQPDKLRAFLAVLRSGIVIASSFLALLACAALILITHLAPDPAKDALWPLYLTESYSRFEGPFRYPYYLGILYFTKIHLPMLIGIFACLASVVCLLAGYRLPPSQDTDTKPGQPGFPYPLLLPPLFFILACFVLLKHAWHYNQYGIYATLGAALALCAFGPRVRQATLVLLLPYLFIAAWAWLKVPLGIQPALPTADLVTPNGCVFEGTPEQVAFYQRVFRALKEEIQYSRTTSSIVVFTDKAGIYYFSGLPLAGRITWYLPGYLRPWEMDSAASAYAKAGAVILKVPATSMDGRPIGQQEISRSLGSLMPPSMVNFIYQRLTHPIYLGQDLEPGDEKYVVWAFAISPEPKP